MLDLFAVGNFVRCNRCGGCYEIVLKPNGQKDSQDVKLPEGVKPVADAAVEFCTRCWTELERDVMIYRSRRLARGELAN